MMPSVRPITIDELERLGIDGSNNLYWDNLPIVIEERVTLQKRVDIAIILGAGATLATAVVEVLRFCGYGA